MIRRNARPQSLDTKFKPELSVSLLIPARNNQEKLDLVLASLSLQTYPARLISVIVIDDGSSKPLTLPKIRPANTRLIRLKDSDGTWGKVGAINKVASSVKSDVIFCLDSDMVVHPDHIAEHLKWHHNSGEYVVLGWKRFVEKWAYSPSELIQSIKAGRFDSLHSESKPHDYVEARIRATNDLRNPKLEGFRAFTGATFSMRTSSWRELGGYNPSLVTGEDTELGWRLTMHGFTLVPEPNARAWHLGVTTIQKNMATIFDHNTPNFENWIPEIRSAATRRANEGLRWLVPDIHAIIDCRETSLEVFRNRIDSLINEGIQTRLTLVGPWQVLEDRYSPLDDKYRDLRSIHNWYHGDDRFDFVDIGEEQQLSIEEILSMMCVSSTAIHLFADGPVSPKYSFETLTEVMLKKELGLLGAVDERGFRAFALFTPALGRARRNSQSSVYKALDQGWGVRWEPWRVIEQGRDSFFIKSKALLKYAYIRFSRVRSWKEFTTLVRRAIRFIFS